MNQGTHNTLATVISTLSLSLSCIAIYLAWDQNHTDYEKSVVISPGTLPLSQINEGKTPLILEVVNTSKQNFQYVLRVTSNMGCVTGTNGRLGAFPCGYQSQVISLSKADAGRHFYKHSLSLDAVPGAVKTNALAYMSLAGYFLDVEIIEAKDGHTLYRSNCFYAYHSGPKAFSIDQPSLDTSGESHERQKQCRS